MRKEMEEVKEQNEWLANKLIEIDEKWPERERVIVNQAVDMVVES